MDCVFPANFSESDAEVYLVIRMADKDHIGQKQDLKVAINEGNVNYERILEENYSGWKTEVYPDIDACLQAVADGKADVVLITSFRYNSISKQCEGLGLTPIATGIGVENEVELMRLQSMGCDLVQGYYFSRPLPAAEYEELIRKSISL